MDLNKAFIIGRLTRDPELKALPSGGNVTTFSLATNRVWKDQNGTKQESTDYHNIVVFGRSAETSAQYLKQGQIAMVEGRMQTRSWEQDGQKRYRTEVVADRVQFGPKAAGASGPSVDGGEGPSPAPSSKPAAKGKPKDDAIEYPEEEINPDDIPF